MSNIRCSSTVVFTEVYKFHKITLLLKLCQVSQLVAQLFQMRVRMKNLLGVMEGGSIPSLSNLEDALKAEEKVPCFHLCAYNLCVYS